MGDWLAAGLVLFAYVLGFFTGAMVVVLIGGK
jgi:hypothetical protein